MSLPFRFATGTVAGRDHIGDGRVHIGQSNQDAVALLEKPDYVVGVVCDGCSSGVKEDGQPSFNQIGGLVGTRLFLRAVDEALRVAPAASLDDRFFTQVKSDMLKWLRELTATMFGPKALCPGVLPGIIPDHLLFTVLGVVMTPARTVIVSFGDGLYALNDRVARIQPREDGKVAYLADALLTMPKALEPEYQFVIRESLATCEVSSILLSTDGAVELVEKERELLPGTSEEVGPISRLWTTESFFESPVALPLHLRALNRPVVRLENEGTRQVLKRFPPLLRDDIAVLVGARRKDGDPCRTEST